MIEILAYSFLIPVMLFVLGIGLTLLIIPGNLSRFSVWLAPWFSIIFLTFFLVVFGLSGFSVSQTAPFLILFLSGINGYVFFIKHKSLKFSKKEDLIIIFILVLSILLNLSPLWRFHQFPTSISFGNNDLIVYALTPDYLVDHSIFEAFETKISAGTGDLLVSGYRWGSPILAAFFLYIFHLEGFQLATIFQVVLFALMIPLIYVLFRTLYKRSVPGTLLCLVTTAFNVNLLYILYHNFFGQVFFWGLKVFILISLFAYFESLTKEDNRLNKFDIIIGVAMSVLFFSYHEGAFFVVVPILFYGFLSFLFSDSGKRRAIALVKIFLVMMTTSSYAVLNAVRADFLQAGGIDGPIGWQVFRNKLPYANPFEILGFYSIHSFEPLPLIVALFLSGLVVAIIGYGFMKSRGKLMLFSFLFIYVLFFIWTTLIHGNFWAYNRAVTYNIFIFVTLFSIGVTGLIFSRKSGIFLILVLIILELFSAYKLNKRYLREHITVDRSYISLKDLVREINLKKFKQPIYTENIIDPTFSLWRNIWTGYFLYGQNPTPSLPVLRDKSQKLPDSTLVLLSKGTPWFKPLRILTTEIMWENQYYRLGRICSSDNCLKTSKLDLSTINIGNNDYEDSLLISGWSIKEADYRWVEGNWAVVRLVTKKSIPKLFRFNAFSLRSPQQVVVSVNGKIIGKVNLTPQPQNYSLPLRNGFFPGVQYVTFEFSKTYRPADFGESRDMRTLAASFKSISIE